LPTECTEKGGKMAEGQGQKGERAKRSRAEGRKIFRPAAQGQGRKGGKSLGLRRKVKGGRCVRNGE